MTIAHALERFPLRTERDAEITIARHDWCLNVMQRYDTLPGWWKDPDEVERQFQASRPDLFPWERPTDPAQIKAETDQAVLLLNHAHAQLRDLFVRRPTAEARARSQVGERNRQFWRQRHAGIEASIRLYWGERRKWRQRLAALKVSS